MHNTSISAKKTNFFQRDRPRDRFGPRKKKFFFVIDSDSVFHDDHFGINFLKIRPLKVIFQKSLAGSRAQTKNFCSTTYQPKTLAIIIPMLSNFPEISKNLKTRFYIQFTSGLVADTCDPEVEGVLVVGYNQGNNIYVKCKRERFQWSCRRYQRP